MKKIKILAICGKSGSGKDYLIRSLVGNNPKKYSRIISCTTRPPRRGEVDGIDYYFVDDNHFLEDKMIEYCHFHKWKYGTLSSTLSWDKTNIGVFSPQALRQLMKRSNLELRIVYLRAGDKERLSRQLNREVNPDVQEIVRRFTADNIDFNDMEDIAAHPNYMTFRNNTLSDIQEISKILGKFE